MAPVSSSGSRADHPVQTPTSGSSGSSTGSSSGTGIKFCYLTIADSTSSDGSNASVTWGSKEHMERMTASLYDPPGSITINLFDDKAPNTVANSQASYRREGTSGPDDRPAPTSKFYNGLTFHRIIKEFMIQGGCPLGNGTGGPGYEFDDEIVPRA